MIQLVNSGETVRQTVIVRVLDIETQIVNAGGRVASLLHAEALSIPMETYTADYENLSIGTGYETEYIELYDSDTATGITINQGGVVVLEAYSEDILPVLSDSTVNAGGLIDLNGGRIENIIVNDQGTIESLFWSEEGFAPCEAFNVTINSGGKFLQYVGEAENTQVKTGGVYLLGYFDPSYPSYDGYGDYVRSDKDHVDAENTIVDGGIFYDYWHTVNNTTVNAGTFNVHGGVAKFTTVSAEGTLNLYSFDYSVYSGGRSICQTDAGIAENTIVNGGRMYLSENTMAKNTLLEAGARMFMTANSIAEGVTISGNSALFLSNGAEAKDVTVNGGMAHIGTGASAVNVTITSGSLYLYGGAILDGTINVSGTLVLEDVTMNYGAVEFQLASNAASQGIMIDNLSLLKGGSVILSADSTQEFGTYRFAGNAGAYTDSIALCVGGVELGELSLNGEALEYQDRLYRLTLDEDSTMALAVRDAVLEPPMVSADILTPTNQSVTLSAVFPEESVVREYSFDGELWLAYESPIVMTENGTVYFRAADEFGMVSEIVCYEVANIDKIPPEQPVAIADIVDPTNGDVVVEGIFSDDSVICEYSLNGIEWQRYEAEITMHENGSVYFRSFDAAGNSSEIARYDVTNIDRIPPEAPVAAANPADPTNQNVLVTAEFAPDAVVKEYSLDGSSWTAYADGVLMTDNGTVYFRSFDAAGNGSDVTEYVVTNIDRIPPEAPVAAADLTELTNQEVLVTAEFTSDAAVREYSLDGSSWFAYADGVRMTENGTVYFRAFDAAGNVSETAEFTVGNIDRNPPAIIIQADNTEPDTEQSVFVSASFTDDIALLSQEYSLDGTAWFAYSSPIEMTKNGTVYFRAQDVAGNMTLEQFTVSNIAEGPESPEGTALSLKKYDLTFSWDKYVAVPGVKVQYQVMIDGVVDDKLISSNKYTLKNASVGEHSFAVRAVLSEKGQEDIRSVWSEELVQVVEDITAPETGKLVLDQISEDTVRLSWTPGEDNVGIVRYAVSCNGEVRELDGETFSTDFSGMAGKVTAEIVAYDEAGNAGKTVKKTLTMTDMTAPSQVTGLRSEGVDNKSGGSLAWDPSTDNVGVTQYLVTIDDSVTCKSSRNTVKIGKLEAGVHFYTVVALDKMKNESVVSERGEFVVLDAIAPKTGKLSLSQTGEDTILAEWTAASDDVGISRYVISCGDEFVRELDGETLFTEISGFSGKVTVEIVAYDETGNAGNTVKKTLTMTDMTAPSQVTGLRSEGVDNKSGGILAWDPSTDNVGVTEYEIAIEGGKTYRSKTSSVKIGKMDAGTYKYTVTAFDKAKNASIVSEEGEFTVADVIDPAIKKFSCKVTNQTLVVSWSAVDETSSIVRSELWLDGLKYADTTGLDSFALNGLELGQHSMELKVWDAAGNEAAKTAKCTIKTLEPASAPMVSAETALFFADTSAKYGMLASV